MEINLFCCERKSAVADETNSNKTRSAKFQYLAAITGLKPI